MSLGLSGIATYLSSLPIVLHMVIERLCEYKGLVVLALLGCFMATSLSAGIPLYMDMVSIKVLEDSLSDPPLSFLGAPPLSFRYSFSFAESNPTLKKVQQTEDKIQQEFIPNMPARLNFSTSYWTAGEWDVKLNEINLGKLKLGALNHSQELPLLSGDWAKETLPPSNSGVYGALIYEDLSIEAGLMIGDTLTLQTESQTVKLVVQAIWQRKKDDDHICVGTECDKVIWIQPRDLEQIIGEDTERIDAAEWYQSYNLTSFRRTDIPKIIRQAKTNKNWMSSHLDFEKKQEIFEGTQENLTTFQETIEQLRFQLLSSLIPSGLVLLRFMWFIAELIVKRQNQDDVLLLSRGMSRKRLLKIHVQFWLIIFAVGLIGGLLLSPGLVSIVARTTSFLQFDANIRQTAPPLTLYSILFAFVTALVCVIGGIFHAWKITNQNISSYGRLTSTVRNPWWKKLTPVILCVIGLLVCFILFIDRQLDNTKERILYRSVVAFIDRQLDNTMGRILYPSVVALGCIILLIWVLPCFLGLVERLFRRTNCLWLMMSLREFTRSFDRYRSTMFMLAFTLSTTLFTVSMSATLDRSLKDQMDFQYGADLVLDAPTDGTCEQQGGTTGANSQPAAGYRVPPISALYQPGVYAVSRVYKGVVTFMVNGSSDEGEILGVDRHTMASVTRFRADYAEQPLAELMNQLALYQNRNGVLLSQELATEHSISVGDDIDLELENKCLGITKKWKVRVRGIVEYFPSTQEKFFVIANIDPLFELFGSPLPHEFWLAVTVEKSLDPESVKSIVTTSGFPFETGNPDVSVEEEKLKPERQGVSGFLSLGFIASLFLTLVAFIVHIRATFGDQSILLARLQAMGLGDTAKLCYNFAVNSLLGLGGVLIGTFAGWLTAFLFLSRLDVKEGVPDPIVEYNWGLLMIVWIGFAFVLKFIIFLTTWWLSRQSISDILRRGDA